MTHLPSQRTTTIGPVTPFGELLQRADDLRAAAESVLQLLVEVDVEELIGASRHQRSAERLNSRNGYRKRILPTQLGPLSLRIPKLRQGSYYPPFLEDCRMTERFLVAAIEEAWTGGVSTQRLSELVQAMGLTNVSKSQLPKLCKAIDLRVRAFLDTPSFWLDANHQDPHRSTR